MAALPPVLSPEVDRRPDAASVQPYRVADAGERLVGLAPERARARLYARFLDGRGWTRLRLVLDALGLSLAVALTVRWPGNHLSAAAAWPLVAFPPLSMVLLWARGMYRRRLRVAILDGVVPVVGAVSVAVMTLVFVEVYLSGTPLQAGSLAHLWPLAVGLVAAGRIAAVGAQRMARASGRVTRTTLIVGAGEVGRRVARRLTERPEYGLSPVGFLDGDPLRPDDPGLPVLGDADDLERVVRQTGAEHVVLAFSTTPDRSLVRVVQRCEALGVEVTVVPRLFESVNDRLSYEPVGGLPLMRLRQTDVQGYRFTVKHLADRVVAAALLTLMSPLMAAIALLVRASSAGPVLFRQRRVGRDGKAFNLLKFRSMAQAPAAAASVSLAVARNRAPGGVEGADRRTGVGRFLRRTSLDEIPQLLNVLRGEMSLVGPRPERPEFVEMFTETVERYDDRHRVKSGITGWAQVHGLRGRTSLSDRVEWDNFYIEHFSLALDLKILALTVVAVVRRAE